MNKKMLKILNDFANDHSLAKGGEIKVTITDYCKSFEPSGFKSTCKYDDVNLLNSLIEGAECLLYFLSRNGYYISKRRKNGFKR